MTYFLDFDRTLFDTDAYNRSLLDRTECASIKDELSVILSAPYSELGSDSPERKIAWDKVSALMQEGTLSFAPGELTPFVYPDVVEFLRQLGNEAIVITYGEKLRQKIKVESALAGIVRLTVLYTGDQHKAEFLTSYPHLIPGKALFVDDYARELENMAGAFPHVSLYQMCRTSVEGDGRWPIISTLHELP